MPDLTTWLIGGFVAANAWFFKETIRISRNQAITDTIIKYYIENQTKDAAIRLEKVDNPTPEPMQKLLQKYRHSIIAKEELAILIDWIETLDTDPNADPAQRSAGLQMLTGMKTLVEFGKLKKKWWQF